MHFKQETECESSEFIKSIPDQYTQFLNKNNHSPLHKYCRFSKIGNCYAIYLNSEEPKFIIGPDWPFFLFSNILIALIFNSFLIITWDILSSSNKIIGILIYLCQVCSYLMTGLLNQGIQKRDDKDLEKPVKSLYICSYCNISITEGDGYAHCNDCGLCVQGILLNRLGFDHHCPWTSKCIGKGNIKYFYSFVISTLLLFIYIICTVISTN